MDMITIAWEIRRGAVPATGQLRFHMPPVFADESVIMADPTLSEWLALDAEGAGSITIPDPRTVAQLPSGWTLRVEVDTDAWTAHPFALCVPEGSATTFTLQELMGLVLVEGA
jgi:hypothetical protein